MSSTQPEQIENMDAIEFSKTLACMGKRSQNIAAQLIAQQAGNPGNLDVDPLKLGRAFAELTTKMMTDPASVLETQISTMQDYVHLWQNTTLRMMGMEFTPTITQNKGDMRFRDEAWDRNQLFSYIKQSYLLAARGILNLVDNVNGMDEKTAQKVEFFTRQFVDALSPTNFAATNPQVLRATLESRGENLIKGLSNLLTDLEAGNGKLRIRMTDTEAFKLGVNIASTPGEVIHQNEMMQLVEYYPSTDTVRKRPLLIVPPWINKFYIMDLQPKNSMIKWLVEQGHTVFVISWVNPGPELANKGFDDYMMKGPLEALDVIEKSTGEKEVNAVGYCLGGTLLATTLAYMKATDDHRISSATFFTTMLDFAEPGELGVFIDEAQIESLEQQMRADGYLDGGSMAGTFSMMRANDLVWSFVINNYLLGKDPFPFDLLYWNSDSTRMPAEMHSFYLRSMYLKNLLKEPGGIMLGGVPIDLSKVDTPSYFLSAEDDHIAPWKSTFSGSRLFSGPVRFVLGKSGHIAGVINPPAANKYGYFTNTRAAKSAETWYKSASLNEGSWWTDWDKWLTKHSGGEDVQHRPGERGVKALEHAPGSYVAKRFDKS